MWDHLSPTALCGLSEIKTIDVRLEEAGPDGYATDEEGLSVHTNWLLERRKEIQELLQADLRA